MIIVNQPLTVFRVRRYSFSHEKKEDYSLLPRPYFTVAYLESGEAELHENGTVTRVRGGDVFLIPEGSTYFSHWTGAPETIVISCHFLFRSGGFFSGKRIPVQHLPGIRDAGILFRRMIEKQQDDSEYFDALAAFYDLCEQMTRILSYTLLPEIDGHIRAAVEYMDSHIGEEFSIDSLAALCHISTSYFYHCFRAELGMTPIDYKRRLAVRRAEQMLGAEPTVSVEEVSERTGFASSTYFRRTFREITGMSPRQYRNKMQKSL